MAKVNLETRFGRHVERHVGTDCWQWTGVKNLQGYGQIHTQWISKIGSRQRLAHVVAYELFVQPVPAGLELDHICHNAAVAQGLCKGGVTCLHRACVNPQHLEAVIHKVNMLRGAVGTISGAQQRAKKHCPQGHEYNIENTRIAQATGYRTCRICYNTAARNWRHRQLSLG